MSLFRYNPARAKAQLKARGYAHLRQVLSPEFEEYLKTFLTEALAKTSLESEDWHIRGKKRQFVFDFPDEAAAEEFRLALTELTEIPYFRFTISERHLKLYDPNAEPFPAPHKDRSASHFSIGLPVRLPAGSTVCMFPDLDPGENPEDHATFLAKGSSEDIRALYASSQAEMLDEAVGDMVVFWGSRIYHERVMGAGTAVLYIKVNGIGEDPLGENIYLPKLASA